MKCLFAINSITAVYRADCAKAMRCRRRRNNSAESELNKTREHTSVSNFPAKDRPPEAPARA